MMRRNGIFFAAGCAFAAILLPVTSLKAGQAKFDRYVERPQRMHVLYVDDLKERCRPVNGLEQGLAGHSSDYRCSSYEFGEFKRGHRLGERMRSLIKKRERALQEFQREEEKYKRILNELGLSRTTEQQKVSLRNKLGWQEKAARRKADKVRSINREIESLQNDIRRFRYKNG